MNNPTATALAMAAGLALLGLITGGLQIAGLRRLAARTLVPSDEFAYLKGRYRRRLVTASVLIVVGGLIGGAYISGMEKQADALGERRADLAPDDPKPPMTDEQKQVFRLWSMYWTVVIVLVFVLVGLAFVDAVASRRYWMLQYRAMRDEHRAKLERDLAVYKQQADSTRGGRFHNRLGDGATE